MGAGDDAMTVPAVPPVDPAARPFLLNGQAIENPRYQGLHDTRIGKTLDMLRRIRGRDVVEVGGHPWTMTARIVEDPGFRLCATISAEEVTLWPDELDVVSREYHLAVPSGRSATFPNYSANIERTIFDIAERPDVVLACEVIEHLLRAPHVMLLNINRWLPVGGKLLLTTPNGAQFMNPLRVKSRFPAYRCNVYARHNYVFTLDGLIDLIGLCGFRVVEAGYWSVYRRGGLSSVYGALEKVPLNYFRAKFLRTLYVVGEKTAGVTFLPRCPKVYSPSQDWEYIDRVGAKPGAVGDIRDSPDSTRSPNRPPECQFPDPASAAICHFKQESRNAR